MGWPVLDRFQEDPIMLKSQKSIKSLKIELRQSKGKKKLSKINRNGLK
jgi:hypothetical protein